MSSTILPQAWHDNMDEAVSKQRKYYNFNMDPLEFVCTLLHSLGPVTLDKILNDEFQHRYYWVALDDPSLFVRGVSPTTYHAFSVDQSRFELSLQPENREKFYRAGREMASKIKRYYAEMFMMKRLSGYQLTGWETEVCRIISSDDHIVSQNSIPCLLKMPLNYTYDQSLIDFSSNYDSVGARPDGWHSAPKRFSNCAFVKQESGFYRSEKNSVIMYFRSRKDKLIRCVIPGAKKSASTISLIKIMLEHDRPINIQSKYTGIKEIHTDFAYYSIVSPEFSFAELPQS
jgi:hypothetical protein